MNILSCYDVKDVHCSIFSKNFHLHKMYYISGSGVDRKGEGGANAQICDKIDALEGSFEVASATALFYLEKGVSLYPKRSFPDI